MVRAEIIISAISLLLGVAGSWVAFITFQDRQRNEIFKERERLIIADENIKQLQKENHAMGGKIDALFRRFDQRMGALERAQEDTKDLLKELTGRRG